MTSFVNITFVSYVILCLLQALTEDAIKSRNANCICCEGSTLSNSVCQQSYKPKCDWKCYSDQPVWLDAKQFLSARKHTNCRVHTIYLYVINLVTSMERISQQRCSIKRCVLKNFAKFIGKHLCQGLFLNKIDRSFPANFAKFLRTPFIYRTPTHDCLSIEFL